MQKTTVNPCVLCGLGDPFPPPLPPTTDTTHPFTRL